MTNNPNWWYVNEKITKKYLRKVLSCPEMLNNARMYICDRAAENNGGEDLGDLFWEGMKGYKYLPVKDVIDIIMEVYLDDGMTEGQKVAVLEDILNYGKPK